MPSIAVIGANRGLGLELARRHAAQGWRVHACCRLPDEAEELQSIAQAHPNLSLHRMNIRQSGQVQAAAQEIEGAIDVLIHNAAINHPWPQGFGENLTEENFMRMMDVNLLGAMRTVEAFLPHLRRGRHKKIALVSSGAGGMAWPIEGFYLYRPSKTALNMLARSLAHDLRPEGIAVYSISPGWFRSRIGGEQAPIDAGQAAAALSASLRQLTMAQTGLFLNSTGEILPY